MPEVLPQVLVTVTNFPTMQTESACCFFSLWCQLLVCLHFFCNWFPLAIPCTDCTGRISSCSLQDSCGVRSVALCYCSVAVPQQLFVASEAGLVLRDSSGHGSFCSSHCKSGCQSAVLKQMALAFNFYISRLSGNS